VSFFTKANGRWKKRPSTRENDLTQLSLRCHRESAASGPAGMPFTHHRLTPNSLQVQGLWVLACSPAKNPNIVQREAPLPTRTRLDAYTESSNIVQRGEPLSSGYHQVPAIESLSEKNRIGAYLCHRIARFSAVPFSQSRTNAYAPLVRKSRHFSLAILHLKCIIACGGWIWSTNISTGPLNRS